MTDFTTLDFAVEWLCLSLPHVSLCTLEVLAYTILTVPGGLSIGTDCGSVAQWLERRTLTRY